MQERIVEFLKLENRPVTSEELAHKVLKLSNAPPGLCDKLVAAAVGDDSCVHQLKDGKWELHPAPKPQESQLVAIKVMPARALYWQQWQGLIAWFVTAEKKQIIKQNRFKDELKAFFKQLQDRIIILEGFGNQLTLFKRAFAELTGTLHLPAIVTLRDLLQSAFPDRRFSSPRDIADFLKTPVLQSAEPEAEAAAFCDQIQAALKRVKIEPEKQLVSSFDFSAFAFDREYIQNLPQEPAVYLMYDRNDQLLYVGKAKNLRQRISSYFTSQPPDRKLERLLAQLYRIEYELKGSELGALLTEQALIHELQPSVNRQIEIKERPHHQKSRYERILILPAAEDRVHLVGLHPLKGLLSLFLQRNFSNEQAVKNELDRFFFKKAQTNKKPMQGFTIALSWLSGHEEEVNSIDMRMVLTADKALDLIKDYLRFSFKDKTIHQ